MSTARLRAFATRRITESGMTCRIERAGAQPGDLDPDTQLIDTPDPELVYDGPCIIQSWRSGSSGETQVAGRIVRNAQTLLRLPADLIDDRGPAWPIRRGDDVYVTGSPDGDVDVHLRIVEADVRTTRASLLFPVAEIGR